MGIHGIAFGDAYGRPVSKGRASAEREAMFDEWIEGGETKNREKCFPK